MFKIFKIIFLGIKDIIRIKKRNNKKYTAKERIEMCESCKDFKPETRQCEICWCFMDIKTKIKNKSCPKDKW
jgi:recombinational DNA repair protein RecR